ncbi:oxidoreductase FAD/NAD(P)-binding [Legionella steigerwaltii]|uniref:Oxidoreductase FAD/NAD(P)-binding n=2 Tax=Legionella steigerwaltii TaxID=460 RepID=A0A378LHH6_9GAMM|nr:oxidoreductase FAD/NAD(P)-binding protein [Legionella steigerwaltii]STY23521.1 oxidoreductase FAD/NAD(P)-binding [Legionella steigerwaltii]
MPTFIVKLIGRKEVAENTMAFTFEKPEGFTFKAGQCGDFTLNNPKETDAEGNTRAFSLTSPPYEKELTITTRVRDTAFKRVLKALPIGSTLQLVGPSGSFTLHNNKSIPAVYVTGGIGITPVRSIVMQATQDQLPHQIFLFYSNHKPEDAAFLDELKSLESKNSNYHFIPTMTRMAESSKEWTGERGYIDKKMLQKYINDLSKPIYYISGPEAMVTAMHSMLNDAGVDDDNIRSEEFPGY